MEGGGAGSDFQFSTKKEDGEEEKLLKNPSVFKSRTKG